MEQSKRIAVLTSGGDAPGMNAAIRAVVRTALHRGAEVFAVHEGYRGMVRGGDDIRRLEWSSVAGILQAGGTVIGTARSEEFRTREGRTAAVRHLIEHHIDRLVVIGGDGSLTGAELLRTEWAGLVAELVERGELDAGAPLRHPRLHVVGLVGSIDNDMAGIDMTIGADTALHRIVEAVDAIASTAASHQRTFVVEVMGRHCGYLALRSAIAGGADWLFIPEDPPGPGWEDELCRALREGRERGRRDSIVIVAEGALDQQGQPIRSEYVRQVLTERLGEDTRVTVLGHVQRGGSPSAFDRYMSTVLGYAAVDELLADDDREPCVIGLRSNRITRIPLVDAVEQTRAVNEAMARGDFETAISLRNPSFRESLDTLTVLMRVPPEEPVVAERPLRLAILHAGGLAPGMNTAARAAVRLGLDRGHTMLGVRDGFTGLVEGDVREMPWRSVSAWATQGGAHLGVTRRQLTGKDLYAIARTIEREQIDGLMMIGGWSGYLSLHRLVTERPNFPAFEVPIVAIPATINNNIPGSENSIGADTALNSIVAAVDKIKQSAVAFGRCFVVEVMGRYCGYLALMSGLATGAERVFLHEEGITLDSLRDELHQMIAGFDAGKRLSLVIRNEHANDVYSTPFICSLFEEEGGDRFDVRQAVLGHQQQGGDPSPFDRILATRLAAHGIDVLVDQARSAHPAAVSIGIANGQLTLTDLADIDRLVDAAHQRPLDQWWLALRPVVDVMARERPPVGAPPVPPSPRPKEH
jgi:6-phosphofructokinase 1